MPLTVTFFLRNHSVFRFLLPVLLLVLTSCEKVLDIDLKDAEPRIIIEANLSDQPGPHTVIISRSVGFNAPNTFPMISGAQVTVSDNTGNSEVLIETEAGIYQTSNFQGVPGQTYTLRVLIEGVEYISVSTMPPAVPIKDIAVETFEFDQDDTVVTIHFQDQAGVKNYYRAFYFVNGKMSDGLYFLEDQYSDGKLIDGTFIDDDLPLESGDSVRIVLQAIDENMLRYLREEDML